MHESTLQDELQAKRQQLADQREANQYLVLTALRAHEQTEQAEAARARADAATSELQASQDRYRTLFELCPAGVYTCDAQGVIQDFNHQATLLWGRTPVPGDIDERFCGSVKLLRADGSVMPHEQCPMADVVRGKLCGALDREVLIERPDGSRIAVVVNIRPLLSEHGQRVGAINCFYDVTARKAAEAELAASLNRERELSEFRELFIGMLGHDLRSPLGAIIGSATALLRRARLTEHDGVAVARILRSGQRMGRLVARVLDFTRTRLGGGLSLEAKPTDLRQICEAVVEEFDTYVEMTADGDIRGTWDPDRLAEALSNLVGNAIRFARPGTAVVVTAQADGPDVVLVVKNQGPPIAPEVLPFIFEPFRSTQGSDRETGNLGLGLYIAHQIALAHQGTLVGHSADGTTAFVMRLPRERATECEVVTPSRPGTKGA